MGGLMIFIVYLNLIVLGVAVMPQLNYQFVVKGLTGSSSIHLLIIAIWLITTMSGILMGSSLLGQNRI